MADGTYALTVTATGGGITKTTLVAINGLPPPSFNLSLSATSITTTPGGCSTTVANTIRTSTFNSAVSLKVTGVPAGITASTGSISAPGSASAPLESPMAVREGPGNEALLQEAHALMRP
jgi:hypothetical protein